MNVQEIKENTYRVVVPRGIRYLSQWQGFQILPFPHILDKQIPGCGFTEYCLTNNQDLVLCSPRKLLLENKYDQHKDDIYYVRNSYENFINSDKDITRDDRKVIERTEDTDEVKKEKLRFYVNLKNDISNYINYRRSLKLPFKIITTYDSFYLVKQILKELNENLNLIQFIVDEMQSIFVDSTFKSDTELSYIETLKDINNLCFVSATPMIEEYLREVDLFKDLPYYELDWETDDPGRVKKPKLLVRSSKSAITTAKEIINKYISGEFEFKYIKTDEKNLSKYFSKEAVIYMNSVNNILNVIKSMDLTPDQCNILCADTPENQIRVRRKLGKKFSIGKVPLRGEPHKMFTFCTRTVYLGADFYSTNARTFIISDANIDTLAVDISLDLPQILGRQRLVENPWKDEATFYYKNTCNNNVITREQLESIITKKSESTKNFLAVFERSTDEEKLDLIENYEFVAKAQNYKRNYVAVNSIYVNPELTIKRPVFNNLVLIAERRAFDIQQIDYANRFNMFSELEESGLIDDKEDVVSFFNEYESQPNLYYKLKFLCEYKFDNDVIRCKVLNNITEKHFREYYELLGPEVCRSLAYNITKINNRLNINTFNTDRLVQGIDQLFKVGDKVSKSDIKNMLENLYNSIDYKASPKASDLENYFELKSIKLKDDTGKWVHGFEIIKKK